MNVICFFEDSAAGLYPVRLGPELIGFDQRLRSCVLKHLPIAWGLVPREINWICPHVLHGQGIVVLG
jgi:hypothetical protein